MRPGLGKDVLGMDHRTNETFCIARRCLLLGNTSIYSPSLLDNPLAIYARRRSLPPPSPHPQVDTQPANYPSPIHPSIITVFTPPGIHTRSDCSTNNPAEAARRSRRTGNRGHGRLRRIWRCRRRGRRSYMLGRQGSEGGGRWGW
jgi:hypothetical protein